MDLHNITSTFIKLFPGDFSGDTMQRQTPGYLFSTVNPADFNDYKLMDFNQQLSTEIGLGDFTNDDLSFLAAQNLLPNVKPYATAYAGHQFGNWAGQLGDGRAIYAGEIINSKTNKTYEIQWKGAGATPYSRHADGRAVLRSSVREYLMSEAMFHLGVPTTRALSLVESGEQVLRDMAYDGNAQYEKGAVVVRVAESFLRFGHFELLAARQELETLKSLVDFAIDNYFPEVDKDSSNPYLSFFDAIATRTMKMIIDWYRVGFVHGVMNTDNMSILGLTIDYGPFSMLDNYDLDFTPNTTDLPGKRYAFGKQAQIAHWNLTQLANALAPLIADNEGLSKVLEGFASQFWKAHDEMLCKKFGFGKLEASDEKFFTDWQQMMQDFGLDYTNFFIKLQTYHSGLDVQKHFDCAIYNVAKVSIPQFQQFLNQYLQRLGSNTITEGDKNLLMETNNPRFVLRNYLLYDCIKDLEKGDFNSFLSLKYKLTNPYSLVANPTCNKVPNGYVGVIGCSMLSCSS